MQAHHLLPLPLTPNLLLQLWSLSDYLIGLITSKGNLSILSPSSPVSGRANHQVISGIKPLVSIALAGLLPWPPNCFPCLYSCFFLIHSPQCHQIHLGKLQIESCYSSTMLKIKPKYLPWLKRPYMICFLHLSPGPSCMVLSPLPRWMSSCSLNRLWTLSFHLLLLWTSELSDGSDVI